jgi:hypothetical protein
MLKKSRDENKKMANLAEEHAYEYYSEKFKDSHTVNWANNGTEGNNHFDLTTVKSWR